MNVLGKLDEAEAVLRQAAAAGHPEALAHVERLVSARQAEVVLRQGAAAGHPEALLLLGATLRQRGALDEAETLLSRADAAGHPKARDELDLLREARLSNAQGAGVGLSVEPRPAASAPNAAEQRPLVPDSAPREPAISLGAIGGLGVLFGRDSSKADRIRAMRDLGTAARARLSAAAGAAGQGRDALAERTAQLLSEVVARLPIRTADMLRREFGEESVTQSQHVIAEAGRLAGLLWTAAATVPGPPPVVHAIKMVIHSAIEIRMIGELYAIHSDGAERDRDWLGTVLLAWSSGQPVPPGVSLTSHTVAIVTKIRDSAPELVGNYSRVAAIASRGRQGADALLRTGARMHNRMRLHPSSWPQPDIESIGIVVRDVAGQIGAHKIGGRIPQALANAARDHLTSSQSPSTEKPISLKNPKDPRGALTQAWVLHQQAVANAALTSTPDPVAARLSAALAEQERRLGELGRRLGGNAVTVPTQRRSPNSVEAGRLVWQAEDMIDLVEETGARSHRLTGWSTRRRAALTYLITALIISAVPSVAIIATSGLSTAGLFIAQCVVLPWLSLMVGVIAIGPLFRPWLGGPVPRHPVIALCTVFGAHIGVGALAAIVGLIV